MTKKTLLVISGIADSIDLATGWMPGPWSFIVDVPVTIAHFLYAGPKAFVVLLEYLPVVGVAPIYTLAAMAYDMKKQKDNPIEAEVIDVDATPTEPAPAHSTLDSPQMLSPSEDATTASKSAEQSLERLLRLLQQQLITPEEFQQKRQQILDQL